MALMDELHERKLKQKQLAKAAGVSAPTVSQWCAGVRPVPPVKARLLHEKFGLPLHVMNPDVWPHPDSDRDSTAAEPAPARPLAVPPHPAVPANAEAA